MSDSRAGDLSLADDLVQDQDAAGPAAGSQPRVTGAAAPTDRSDAIDARSDDRAASAGDRLTAARLKTVRDHMALECEHDWDGVIATFEHPRYEMMATGAVFDGEDEVRGYFASSRETFPDLTNEVIAMAADPDTDTVLVEFWLKGTHLGPLRVRGRTWAPTGRTMKMRMAASFVFAPGSDKIVCERPFSSTDARLRALELE